MFWLIWNPAQRLAVNRFYSAESATQEAERLAGAHPGETFIVLHSVCARRCGPMERIDLSRPEDDVQE